MNVGDKVKCLVLVKQTDGSMKEYPNQVGEITSCVGLHLFTVKLNNPIDPGPYAIYNAYVKRENARSLLNEEPISVHGAEEGKPFTVHLNMRTVTAVRQALEHLEQLGYGNTIIMRTDTQDGPYDINNIALYDTSEGMRKGIYSSEMTFLVS